MDDPRIDALWVRHLAGEQLAPADAQLLLAAFAADPSLRERCLADRALEGALFQAGRSAGEHEAFAAQVREVLLADGSGERFVAQFKARLEQPAKPKAPARTKTPVPAGAKAPARSRRPAQSARLSRAHGPVASRWWWQAGLAAAAAVIVVAILLRPDAAAAKPLAWVDAVAGEVVIRHGQASRPALNGAGIVADEVLVTAADGRATLRYANEDTSLALGADTRLGVGTAAGGKHLRLEAGRVDCQVAPQPSGRPLVLSAPQATATVIGTTFSLSASAARAHLEVLHGVVRLSASDGRSVEVAAGTFADYATGSLTTGMIGAPPDEGLVGHWTFDEGQGLQAGDSSGSGRAGTLVAGVTWGAGRLGGALHFDGRSGYVQIAHAAALAVDASSDVFTLALWVQTTGTAGPLLCQSLPSGRVQHIPWVLEIELPDNLPKLGVWRWQVVPGSPKAGVLQRTDSAAPALHDGRWHHLAFVNRSPILRELYVDGVRIGSESIPWTSDCRNDEPLDIGRFSNQTIREPPHFFSGAIDDLRIYRRALEGAEIQRLAEPTPADAPAK